MVRSGGLRAYLVKDFDATECQMPIACAVSAYDEDDALELIRATYAAAGNLPRPGSVEELGPEEIQLRLGHLDFGVPVARGICYPHVSNP